MSQNDLDRQWNKIFIQGSASNHTVSLLVLPIHSIYLHTSKHIRIKHGSRYYIKSFVVIDMIVYIHHISYMELCLRNSLKVALSNIVNWIIMYLSLNMMYINDLSSKIHNPVKEVVSLTSLYH
jgi:hypothetical protein